MMAHARRSGRNTIAHITKFLESANYALYNIVMSEANSPPASRARLAAVLRAATDVVSIDMTAKTLDLDRTEAAKLLSRWRAQDGAGRGGGLGRGGRRDAVLLSRVRGAEPDPRSR